MWGKTAVFLMRPGGKISRQQQAHFAPVAAVLFRIIRQADGFKQVFLSLFGITETAVYGPL